MQRQRTSALSMPRAAYGRMLLALAVLGFGARYAMDRHLSAANPPLPAFLPFGTALSIAAAILLIACGLALLTTWRLRESSLALAVLLLGAACLHLLHLEAVLHDGTPRSQFMEPLAMGTSAFVLYGLAHHPKRLYLFIAARILFAATIIMFGIQHFLYLGFLAGIIPAWIPYHIDWVYATGAAMIAVGLAMISGIFARPATMALAVMFLAWLAVLHIPLIVASPRNLDLWSDALVALGMCGASLLMSTSPRVPALRYDLNLETQARTSGHTSIY
jgi:uncharacterized membrane protein